MFNVFSMSLSFTQRVHHRGFEALNQTLQISKGIPRAQQDKEKRACIAVKELVMVIEAALQKMISYTLFP